MSLDDLRKLSDRVRASDAFRNLSIGGKQQPQRKATPSRPINSTEETRAEAPPSARKQRPRITPPGYLRPKDAAAFLGISVALLNKRAKKGEGPKRRKIGKAVLYAVKDLDAWMETQTE